MGRMKDYVMEQENLVADEMLDQADGCKNFYEFKTVVVDAYQTNDYLRQYTEAGSLHYVEEVASQLWFDELGRL